MNFSEERKVFYSTEGISHKNFMERLYKKKSKSHSVMSNSLQPHGL